MIAPRILAVLSATLLVGAVALATIGPPTAPLGQMLFLFDHGLMDRLHTAIAGHMADWVWYDLAVPLLVRPVWLLPASAGILCAGLALSLANRKPARRSHRRSQ